MLLISLLFAFVQYPDNCLKQAECGVHTKDQSMHFKKKHYEIYALKDSIFSWEKNAFSLQKNKVIVKGKISFSHPYVELQCNSCTLLLEVFEDKVYVGNLEGKLQYSQDGKSWEEYPIYNESYFYSVTKAQSQSVYQALAPQHLAAFAEQFPKKLKDHLTQWETLLRNQRFLNAKVFKERILAHEEEVKRKAEDKKQAQERFLQERQKWRDFYKKKNYFLEEP